MLVHATLPKGAALIEQERPEADRGSPGRSVRRFRSSKCSRPVHGPAFGASGSKPDAERCGAWPGRRASASYALRRPRSAAVSAGRR